MVEVKNISKKYGSHVAVDGISFHLEPGCVYGLLGPNGAGKSTTMNIMTGYIAPSGGEVSIDGYDIYEDAVHAKMRIGYLPENPPLYLDMTVHEYLMFVAELKGIKKRKERYLAVESIMEDSGTLNVANQLIRTLSKGYRQRVGFAAAIVNDPQVIILDEPTVGLDPKQIIEFRDMIRELGREHVVLLSSHILSEIAEVCDHVFIINAGKLIVDDAVENLDKYANVGSKVCITIKGETEIAAKAIRDLPGVQDVQSEGEDTLVVETESGGEELMEQISLALMEQKILILGMQEEKGSLEQIFLEVTENEDLLMDASEGGAADSENTDEFSGSDEEEAIAEGSDVSEETAGAEASDGAEGSDAAEDAREATESDAEDARDASQTDAREATESDAEDTQKASKPDVEDAQESSKSDKADETASSAEANSDKAKSKESKENASKGSGGMSGDDLDELDAMDESDDAEDYAEVGDMMEALFEPGNREEEEE